MPDRDQSRTSNRGFASMDDKRQRDIASKGGQAAEAGRKGGQTVADEERSFSRDRELAAEAGRKGGEHSHGSQQAGQVRSGQVGSSHQGGRGNFAEDRERASEAGSKGGEHSQDRR
jgi:uncharacterized protein